MRINYKIDWQALGEMEGSRPANPKKYLLLEAALKTLARHGVQSLSVTSLAKETGLSKPLVLYHYESKERILEDLYFYMTKMGEYFINSTVREEGSYEEKVRDMVVSYFRWSLFNKEVAAFFCLIPHLGHQSRLLKQYREAHRIFVSRSWERIFLESLRFRSMEELKITTYGVSSLVIGSLVQLISENQMDDHLDLAQSLKFNLEALLKVELPAFNLA